MLTSFVCFSTKKYKNSFKKMKKNLGMNLNWFRYIPKSIYYFWLFKLFLNLNSSIYVNFEN